MIQTRAEGVLCPKFKGKKYWTINGQDLYVDDRYEVTKKIGFGAYGMVFAAKDNKLPRITRLGKKWLSRRFKLLFLT